MDSRGLYITVSKLSIRGLAYPIGPVAEKVLKRRRGRGSLQRGEIISGWRNMLMCIEATPILNFQGGEYF